MGRREQQIRNAIEAKGYEVYDLHYERPGMYLEKGGQEGGWYGDTSYESIACWTYQDALDEIAGWPSAEDLDQRAAGLAATSREGDGDHE